MIREWIEDVAGALWDTAVSTVRARGREIIPFLRAMPVRVSAIAGLRPIKIRLHVNKNEIRKGAAGFPWTIHTSKGCTRARDVEIRGDVRTEYRPDLPSNPKVFLLLNGYVEDLGGGHFRIKTKV